MDLHFKTFFEQQTMKTKIKIFDFDSTLARVPIKPEITPEGHAAIAKLRSAKKKHKAIQNNTNATNREKQASHLELQNATQKVHELLKGWNGTDWWGHEASLGDQYYPNKEMNDSVVEAMRKAKSDPEAYVAVLTGRRDVSAPHVRQVLKHHSLHGKRYIPDSNKKALQNHNHHPDDEGPDSHDEFYSGDLRTEKDYPQTAKGKPVGDTWTHKEYAVVNKMMNHNIQSIETWDDRSDHIPHWKSLGVKMLKTWPNLKEFTIHQVFNTPQGHYIVDIPVTI